MRTSISKQMIVKLTVKNSLYMKRLITIPLNCGKIGCKMVISQVSHKTADTTSYLSEEGSLLDLRCCTAEKNPSLLTECTLKSLKQVIAYMLMSFKAKHKH